MSSPKVIAPLLTAVVPVTRMANQLNLLDQWIKGCTGKSIEIILLHDIRDEETSFELENIVSNNFKSNIVLFEGKYGSPGSARNLGIQMAKGEWVAFWDCDDKPNVDTVLQILQSESGTSNFEVIIGQFNVYDVIAGNMIGKNKRDSSLSDVALNPGVWRMLFRKDTIGDVRFPHIKMAEDQNFLSAIRLPEKKFKIMNEIFYTYYLGNLGQLTAQKSAVDEIINAARFTLLRIKDSKGATLDFNATLFSRQIITGIMKGSLKIKFKCISLFMKSIVFNKGLNAIVIIGKVLSILLQRNRRKLA